MPRQVSEDRARGPHFVRELLRALSGATIQRPTEGRGDTIRSVVGVTKGL